MGNLNSEATTTPSVTYSFEASRHCGEEIGNLLPGQPLRNQLGE